MKAAGVAGLVTALLLASCSHPAARSLPATDASPATVLGAYLEALKAGDCTFAHKLATKTFAPSNGELCAGGLKVTAYGALHGPAGDASEVTYGTTLTIKGGDGSMPQGKNPWFYSLAKQPDGSWRLVGGGSGP